LLTGAKELTKRRIIDNEKKENACAVLKAFNIPFDKSAVPEQILQIYRQNISERTTENETIYYQIASGNKNEAFALPFSGQGLWGPIKGILSLESDGKTIRKLVIYRQEETPGLGGEIASESFTNSFIGKSIIDKNETLGIRIVKDTSKLNNNEVDSITGATMSSKKLEDILNNAIKSNRRL